MVCGNDNRCQCNIGFEPVDVSTCEGKLFYFWLTVDKWFR